MSAMVMHNVQWYNYKYDNNKNNVQWIMNYELWNMWNDQALKWDGRIVTFKIDNEIFVSAMVMANLCGYKHINNN